MMNVEDEARLNRMPRAALIIARNLLYAEYKALEKVPGSYLDRFAIHEELVVINGIFIERAS